MLTDDGSYTLRDVQLGETYHSGCGALAECLHVYLRNSGVEALLERRNEEHRSGAIAAAPVRVLEFGFGTGMACLLTMAAARAHDCPLEYVSLEHALLPIEVLSQLRIGEAVNLAIARGQLPAGYAVASELERDWLAFRASLPGQPAKGELLWNAGQGSAVRLVIGDAEAYAAAAGERSAQPFDALYFDAFSPATNPTLWTEHLFAKLTGLLDPEGLLVSYCVSGAVRRGLEAAGFDVERRPGPPGGKREVLVARRRFDRGVAEIAER
ncbi:MAG: tRNA (5-methylaminomethyl-2-thiouridine)(34)-methyltransferase MnmD [Aureliella sp.]